MKTIVFVLAMLMLVVIAVACPAHGQAVRPRAATLQQQKMCAEQAEKFFAKETDGLSNDHSFWSYVSHYDAPANVCYILLRHTVHLPDHSKILGREAYDAFEGVSHGTCTGYDYESPIEDGGCFVNNHGHYTNVKSIKAFDQAAYLCFGIEP